jgi:sulfatase maturation enzyme AslB (radical SAM superfamily)
MTSHSFFNDDNQSYNVKAVRDSYVRFLPLVVQGSDGRVDPVAAEPHAIGNFLCRVFERWIKEDVPFFRLPDRNSPAWLPI